MDGRSIRSIAELILDKIKDTLASTDSYGPEQPLKDSFKIEELTS